MVSNTEFRNPGQMQTAFQREVSRERLVAYERHAQATTGRVVLRDLTPGRPVNGGVVAPTGIQRVPFENRERGGRLNPAPAAPRGPEIRPMNPTREGRVPMERPHPIEERRPDAPPASTPRGNDDRRVEAPRPTPRSEERPPKAIQERRPDLPPARERFEDRPRPEERRPDPTPRERMPEYRPRPEERRPDLPRPTEIRPTESRPAPKPEAPREKPREEKKGEGIREIKR
jgi:hypothetical protein